MNKGYYKIECNRTVCKNKNAVFFNHSTLKYYCPNCAYEINKWAQDFKLEKGHELCVLKLKERNESNINN